MKIEVKTKFNINGGTASQIKRQPAREQKPGKKSAKKQPVPEMVQEKPSSKKPRVTMPKITLPHIALPKISVPHFKVPRFRFKGMKPVYFALIPVCMIALMLILWLGMNVWKHASPKPLFTEATLKPVPSADSNGCVLLYDDQVYNEYSTKDVSDVNMFRNAASMEVFLDKTRDEYAFAKTMAGRDDVKKMMDLYREIIMKPEFADTVQPDTRDARKISVFLALHNAITATIIANMQEKKQGAAFALMRDQLNLNARYFKSARSMTNYLMSLRAYDKSLGILKSMLALTAAGGGLGATSLTACREMADMMRSFNPRAVPLAPIVVFEYLLSWKQTFNPAIEHPEAPIKQGMKRKALVFFDRGLTQKWNDERWKNIYDLAKNPNDVDLLMINKLQEQRYTAKRFWWFHNAVGKKYLDSIPLSIFQMFPEAKNTIATVSQRQGEIITTIDSLKEEVKPEKKPVRQQRKPVKKKPLKKTAAS
jgi:hypothetical protein